MSIDEALRALEKKWRGESATGFDGDGNLSDTWTAQAMRSCADELAALLTTRQEVAPVAWMDHKGGVITSDMKIRWESDGMPTGYLIPLYPGPMTELPLDEDDSLGRIHVLQDMFVVAANERRMAEVDALAYAIAAITVSTGQTSDARGVVLESELEKSSGRACDFTWDAPVVLLDTAIALMRGQSEDARDAARLAGADERTQLLFDAKNYWADRSRELEARLVALRDGYRDGSFSDLPGINNAAIAAKLFADELTALLESKP